jgi:hypothetical protein
MNSSTTRNKSDRTRGTERLRNLTIGTTLAGLAASAGFGWLAAATYDGSSLTTAAVTDTSTSTGSSATSTANPTDTTGSSSSSSSSSMPSSGGVSSSSGRAHATTGGS